MDEMVHHPGEPAAPPDPPCLPGGACRPPRTPLDPGPPARGDGPGGGNFNGVELQIPPPRGAKRPGGAAEGGAGVILGIHS